MFERILAAIVFGSISLNAWADAPAAAQLVPPKTVPKLVLVDGTKFDVKCVTVAGKETLFVETAGKKYLTPELRIQHEQVWQVLIPAQIPGHPGVIFPRQEPIRKQ